MQIFIWSIFFGLVGFGYFSYGKRNVKDGFFYVGLALMIFPYFVDGLTSNILVGVGLIVAPFIMQKLGE